MRELEYQGRVQILESRYTQVTAYPEIAHYLNNVSLFFTRRIRKI